MGYLERLESIAPGFIARSIPGELKQYSANPDSLTKPLKDLELSLEHPELIDVWNILRGIRLCESIRYEKSSAKLYLPRFHKWLSMGILKDMMSRIEDKTEDQKLDEKSKQTAEMGPLLLSVYFLGPYSKLGFKYLKQLTLEEMVRLRKNEYRVAPKGEKYISRFDH